MSIEVETLKKELEELQNKSFYLQMCDHWSSDDYKTDREWHTRILEIKKELKEKYGIEVK